MDVQALDILHTIWAEQHSTLALLSALVVASAISGWRRRRRRGRSGSPAAPGPAGIRLVAPTDPPATAEAGAGRRALAACDLRPRAIMSREQAKLGRRLRRYADDEGLGLAPEVSMGAFLEARHRKPGLAEAARRAFAQKRVDFLLTDRAARPLCAVEYHGSGHWQGDAADRDSTKRLALERAGLPLVEVPTGWSWEEVRGALDAAVRVSR